MVECQQEGERVDQHSCEAIEQPDEQQPCYTGVACAKEFVSSPVRLPAPTIDRYRYVAQAPFNQWNDDTAQHDSLSFSNPAGAGMAQPRFFPGQWSPCSATCGPGVSTRTVECVAIQGITSNIIKLPDYECEGTPKPSSFQPCQIRQCPLSESVGEPPERERSLASSRGFKWDYGDWTACSASCLGGKQKSTLKCVDVMRKTVVAWSFCDAKRRPIDLTRSCNNEPCPPTWDVGEMSQCSHTCGGGLRTRKVRCIRRISRTGGAESTLILPDAQCPYPKPQDKEACGLINCPIMWKVDVWSQCSASCGPGEQRREVTCEQRSADGEVRVFNPPNECRHLQKPPTVQLCNLGSCTADGSAQIGSAAQTSSTDFDQQQSHHRKLTLNVGGRANLYQGTSIKVKCPVRNFAKNKIEWTKDGKKIINNAHIKVSSNGALRIFHARMEDAGVYACFAGGIQGNVTLTFKHREDLREERENESRSMLDKAAHDDGSNDTPSSVDHHLVQKVLMSLRRNGEMRMFEKLSSVKEPGKLKVDFAIGEWSKCSQSVCGKSDGAQVRQLKCRVLFEGMVGYLDDDVCESFGVIRPPSSRSCGPSYCPHWEATEWSECSTSRCIRHATSMQKRDVRCIYDNGTDADFALCDRGNRPKVKKECINMNCTAEWRPSVWGQCSRTCGDGGVQMRLLRCVWRGTRKAAGRHCQTSTRPSAIRACVHQRPLPPCHSTPPADARTSIEDNHCIDKSRYCEILKLFHACDNQTIREKCCHTCHYYDYQIVRTRRMM
uniref:ADAMTS-like protein 3 n=1 Tax=Ascaris suum TaxID=6253 RepID=F1KU82_ASCSU